MKFSIIIPAYNAEASIKHTLESLVSQTFDNKDYEIILVDDCSTDNTTEEIQRFFDNQPNAPDFQLILHSENRRQGAARNTGIKAARGEWLMFVDADDFWTSSNVLSSFAELINRVDVDLVTSIHPIAKDEVSEPHLKFLRNVSNEENLLTDTFGCSVCQSCYRKKCIVDNGCWFREKVVYEDADWTRQAAWCCKWAALVDFPFYHYSTNLESTTQKPRLQTLLDQVIAVDALFKWANSQADLPEQVRRKVIDPDAVIWVLMNSRRFPIHLSLKGLRIAIEMNLLNAESYPIPLNVKHWLLFFLLKTVPRISLSTIRMAYITKKSYKFKVSSKLNSNKNT